MDEYVSVNVRFDRKEAEKLDQLAASAYSTRSHIVRSLVARAKLVTVAVIGDDPQSAKMTSTNHAVK